MKNAVIFTDSAEVKSYVSELENYGIAPNAQVYESLESFKTAIGLLSPDVIIADDAKIKIDEFASIIIKCSWRVFKMGTMEIASKNHNKFKFYVSYCGEADKIFDERIFYKEIDEAALTDFFIEKYRKLSNGIIVSAIKDFFVKIGIYSNLLGYDYLLEAVLMSYNNKKLINSVTTELYPMLAEKFNTNYRNIERNMRNAIEISCNRGKFYEIANSVGGNFDVYEKPSNSEFIAFLVDRISIMK